MSETGHSGINRPFSWLKKILQITEKTVAPDSLLPNVRTAVDLFGWERYDLGNPVAEAVTGVAASDNINLATVPEGVLRYYLHVSCGHDDALNLLNLCLQVVTDGQTVAVAPAFLLMNELPISTGISRPILLRPGEFLRCRSAPAPAGAATLIMSASFIDLEPGEYIAPL